MSDHRYYTPDLSEFHVGFEYEFRPIIPMGLIHAAFGKPNTYEPDFQVASFGAEFSMSKEDWNSYSLNNITPPTLSTIHAMIKDKVVRVKHLDKMDFLRLHFSFEGIGTHKSSAAQFTCDHQNFSATAITSRGQEKLKIYFTPVTSWVLLQRNDSTVYAGKVKNYTKLQQLMEALGIKTIIVEE